MDESTFFGILVVGWLVTAAVMGPVMWFIPAPYGRHGRPGFGPTIHPKLGWVLMEAPAPVGFLVLFLVADRPVTAASVVFLLLWELHYVNRSFVFPLRMRKSTHRMPVFILATAGLFNLVNAYLNGRWIFTLSPGYPSEWLADPRFIVGALMFFTGMVINQHSDGILRRLRDFGTGYKIPRGGLFRWVSGANYFGEMVEWCGWALATWSLAGLSFALWTTVTLATRAWTHHRWYRRQFPDYPADRKAVIPFLF